MIRKVIPVRVSTQTSERPTLQQLEADFLRLIKMERDSDEFMQLYRRFDADLGEVMRMEEASVPA